MTHDQADNLRELVRRRFTPAAPGPSSQLITVVGGKGGLGASTIALNLAVALAAQGRRTVLVEADLDRSTSGVAVEDGHASIVDALTGRRSVHEILRRGPGGIQVVPGAFAPAEVAEYSPVAQQRFMAELKSLGRHAEAVVIDAGSSRNPFTRRLWQATDLVLLVTSTEPGAIMESYAAIKVLSGGENRCPIYTLANRAQNEAAAKIAYHRIAEPCRRFLGVQTFDAGHVPLNAGNVRASERMQLFLLQSRCPAARSIERVAEKIWSAINARQTPMLKYPLMAEAHATDGITTMRDAPV